MSHETHSDLFKNMTEDMLLRRLKQLDRDALRYDEFDNEPCYPNWRGCSNVLIEREYDGHTERQADRNIERFCKDVVGQISNGSAIVGIKESHLYQKMPKKLPKKYQAIEPVYDWYVINDCHC